MSQKLYIVPDTGFFIECKPANEIDWAKYYEQKEINILLIPTVIEEIDSHKGGQNKRRSKKARQVISFLQELLLPEKDSIETLTKTGQTLRFIFNDVELETFEQTKRIASNDDKIIASALKISKDFKDDKVVFICSDFGALLKAKSAGVPFLKIPDEWKVESEKDDERDEVKQLKFEISQLKKTSPYIEIKKDFFEVESIIYSPLTNKEIDYILDIVKKENPPINKTDLLEAIESSEKLNPSIISNYRFRTPSTDSIERYYFDYEEWTQKYRQFLADFHKTVRAKLGIPFIKLLLQNTGGIPATETLVKLTPRDDILLSMDSDFFHNDESFSSPIPPEPPKGEWRSLSDVLSPNLNTHFDTSFIHPNLNNNIRDSNSFYFESSKRAQKNETLELTCQQWRHGLEPEEFKLFVVTKPDDTTQQARISLEVHSNTLSLPLKKNINIKIKNMTLSCFDIAISNLT